jgi:putative intracellular protease/amidase
MDRDDMEALFIMPERGFEDEEVNGLVRVFETNDIHITYVTPSGDDARGRDGLFIDADEGLDDVDSTSYDVVIVIGCSGSETELTDQRLRDVIEHARDEGAIIGSVCMATKVLASFGLLADARVAVPTGIQIDVGEMVAEVVPGDVARSNGMFTCASGEDAEEMAEQMVEYLVHGSEHDA